MRGLPVAVNALWGFLMILSMLSETVSRRERGKQEATVGKVLDTVLLSSACGSVIFKSVSRHEVFRHD